MVTSKPKTCRWFDQLSEVSLWYNVSRAIEGFLELSASFHLSKYTVLLMLWRRLFTMRTPWVILFIYPLSIIETRHIHSQGFLSETPTGHSIKQSISWVDVVGRVEIAPASPASEPIDWGCNKGVGGRSFAEMRTRYCEKWGIEISFDFSNHRLGLHNLKLLLDMQHLLSLSIMSASS